MSTGNSIITLVVTENPKRGASKDRYDAYKSGQTVDEFIAAGGTRGDVNWDIAHGFITVEIVAAPEKVKEEKPAKVKKSKETAPEA